MALTFISIATKNCAYNIIKGFICLVYEEKDVDDDLQSLQLVFVDLHENENGQSAAPEETSQDQLGPRQFSEPESCL